jgi:uncharacterized membrane protein YfcA
MDILMIVTVFVSYVIKGLCGFASTMIFSTALSFRDDNIRITPIDLFLGYPTNIVMMWRDRKSLSAKVWLPLSLVVLVGSAIGSLSLKNADAHLVKIIFGFIITGLGIEMLLSGNGTGRGKLSRPAIIVLSLGSGILCGLFGIGAMLAACVREMTGDSSSFRGNLCMVFFMESTFRAVLYYRLGILSAELWWKAFSMLPFMILGMICGIFISKRIREQTSGMVINIMLILSGAVLTINNLIR